MEKVLKTAVVEAERYVQECEEQVLKYVVLIDKFEKGGRDKAVEQARKALVSVENDLHLARAHLSLERAIYEAPLT